MGAVFLGRVDPRPVATGTSFRAPRTDPSRMCQGKSSLDQGGNEIRLRP